MMAHARSRSLRWLVPLLPALLLRAAQGMHYFKGLQTLADLELTGITQNGE